MSGLDQSLRLRALALSASVTLFAACGKSSSGEGSGDIIYALERSATASTKNALLFDVPSDAGLQFAISGERFSADVPFDSRSGVVSRVNLSYLHFGTYTVTVKLWAADGTPMLEDELTWEYATEIPENPIASFDEEATNDKKVDLLFSTSRGPKVEEVFIAGDLAETEHPEGSWRAIPDNSRLPIEVSDGDGIKTLTVRYRNRYGVESEDVQLAIERKGTGPTSCAAAVIATKTPDDHIKLKVSGQDAGEIFYRVLGDVKELDDFKAFRGTAVTDVELSAGEGAKSLTVMVRDAAENFCLREDFVVEVDKTYEPQRLDIVGSPLWTNDQRITIKPWIDHFADDVVEMKIEGGVVGAGTQEWRDFAESANVDLSLSEGHRVVIARFRVNGEEIPAVSSASVYLRPFAWLAGGAAPYTLRLSEIRGAEGITVDGCAEGYEIDGYSTNLPCTPGVSGVTVTYRLQDGTTVVREAEEI